MKTTTLIIAILLLLSYSPFCIARNKEHNKSSANEKNGLWIVQAGKDSEAPAITKLDQKITYKVKLNFRHEKRLSLSTWSLVAFTNAEPDTLSKGNSTSIILKPRLPQGYDWLRDSMRNVRGLLTIKMMDNRTHKYHLKVLQVSILSKPETPVLSIRNIYYSDCEKPLVSFSSAGATSYRLFGGVLDESLQASAEPSMEPIDWVAITIVPNSNIQNLPYTLDPLLGYKFYVDAINPQGYSKSDIAYRYPCENRVSIYPNPIILEKNYDTKTYFTVAGGKDFLITKISILSAQDPNFIRRFDYQGNQVRVDVDIAQCNFVPGIYVVTAYNAKTNDKAFAEIEVK